MFVELTLNLNDDIVQQIVNSLIRMNISKTRIAQLLHISRATLYNRYISREKYLARLERNKQIRSGRLLIIKKSKRERKKKRSEDTSKKKKSQSYFTKEQITTLARFFKNSDYRIVASYVKKHIAREDFKFDVFMSVLNSLKNKDARYIIAALRDGAYYKEYNKRIEQRIAIEREEIKKLEKENKDVVISDTERRLLEKMLLKLDD